MRVHPRGSGGAPFTAAPKPRKPGTVVCGTCGRTLTPRGFDKTKVRTHKDPHTGTACAGSPTPPSRVRPTVELAAVDGTRLSPKGTCYVCARPVGPDRKFCGPCQAPR